MCMDAGSEQNKCAVDLGKWQLILQPSPCTSPKMGHRALRTRVAWK